MSRSGKRASNLSALARGAHGDGTDRRSRLAAIALGREGDSGAMAYVALKYYRPEHQCLSEWTGEELRAFSEFCSKVSRRTWTQIYASGGHSGSRTGLGYEPVPRVSLPDTAFLADVLSEDITWFELRVTQKARVFGFRAEHAFFLVFLDKNHQITG